MHELIQDHYGYELSSDQNVAHDFLIGLEHSLTFDHSGIDALERAHKNDPDFGLNLALLGRQRMIHGQRSLGSQNIEAAQNLTKKCTTREKSLIHLLHLSNTFSSQTIPHALEHLENWPRDIIAFGLLIGPFGLYAMSGKKDWREINLALLDKMKEKWPKKDWWFLASHSFAHAEIGNSATSLELGYQSMELKQTGTAAHSISHAQIELGLKDEGLTFAKEWLNKFGAHSDMRHHINWHRAVFEYDLDHHNETNTNQHFETELSSKICDPMPLSTFSDNASFLWRMHLKGIQPKKHMIDETLAYLDRHFGMNTGFAFGDLHKICVISLCDDDGRKQTLLANFEAQNAELMINTCKGFFAYADKDYLLCRQLLNQIEHQTMLIGGSNPQRRIISDTLQSAQKHIQKASMKDQL